MGSSAELAEDAEFSDYMAKLRGIYAVAERNVLGKPLPPGPMVELYPRADPITSGINHARLEAYERAIHLREQLEQEPKGQSPYRHGEDLYGFLIFLSVLEMQQGMIRQFEQFREVMEHLLGERVRPFLESLYLATLRHPSLDGLEADWEQVAEIARIGYCRD